jgi:hypothetical protein
MEHVKEHHHADATKRIDEGREQRDRRNQTTQHIEEIEDERPQQESRHQNRPYQCQQGCILECHGRRMNGVSVGRNYGSGLGAERAMPLWVGQEVQAMLRRGDGELEENWLRESFLGALD